MRIAGRYDVGSQIGAGGSGAVYRGVDLRLNRAVAIKVVHPMSSRAAQRELVEIRTMAAATGHPNVVALYDALLPERGIEGEDGRGHAVLVMELVDGPSLAAVMSDGPLPLGVVRQVGVQVASALAHLHRQGIVHRDVKPANILIAPDGQAKLSDFGISRLEEGSSLTATGLLLGSAGYLSPEQVEGRGAGGSSDVYSLGLVLLEAITGRREFGGPPTEAALARLSRQPEVPDDLPMGLRDLVTSMVERDPADRPTASEAARRLRECDLREAPPVRVPLGLAALGADDSSAADSSADDSSAADSGADDEDTAVIAIERAALARRMPVAVAAAAVVAVLLGAWQIVDGDTVSPASPSRDSDAAASPTPLAIQSTPAGTPTEGSAPSATSVPVSGTTPAAPVTADPGGAGTTAALVVSIESPVDPASPTSIVPAPVTTAPAQTVPPTTDAATEASASASTSSAEPAPGHGGTPPGHTKGPKAR